LRHGRPGDREEGQADGAERLVEIAVVWVPLVPRGETLRRDLASRAMYGKEASLGYVVGSGNRNLRAET
jgi:hypothetical protein